jgi:tRNA 2-selenouridine synthase SelU
MKVISDYPELKGQLFDSIEECSAEEQKIDVLRAQKDDVKKKYSAAIDAAKANVHGANKAYCDARKEAQKIAAEANAKIDSLLKEKRANIIEAEKNYRKAVCEYTKNVGPYKVSYPCQGDDVDENLVDFLNTIIKVMC